MNKKNEAYETVQIPKATADFIRKQEHFKIYSSLDDFVMEAVRKHFRKMLMDGIMK